MTRPRLRRDPLRPGAIITLRDGRQYVRCWPHPRTAWAQIAGTLSNAEMADLADQIIHVGSIK